MSYLQVTREMSITQYAVTRLRVWGEYTKFQKGLLSKMHLSSNLCLDFNKQGIVASQKFSEYRWVAGSNSGFKVSTAEFCHRPLAAVVTTEVGPQNYYSLCSGVRYDTDTRSRHKGCPQENKTLLQVKFNE